MIRYLVRKLFAVDTYFTIAIKHRDENIIDKKRFISEYTIPATRQEWCADPFLAQQGDKTFLFYEKVHGDLGSIEVVEVLDNCQFSEPTVLFSDGTHWSYPNVFRTGEQWYMIPESSALKEVSLYSAEEFPYRWKKERVLLQEAAVDTTVFSSNGQRYLLTFVPAAGTERVRALAFRMDGTELVPLQWEGYDPLRVRGAGSPFSYQGSLVRPVQVSTDKRYGDGIAFVKMRVDGDTYEETVVAELTPERIKSKGQFYDGLHTYNDSDLYEVIDIRCGKLNLMKPLVKIIRNLH